jgi:adenine-specific DNA-methyltransferase
VRYIVENTVGKLIEGKTPAQIAEMKFADIACGSGSFLLGVYDLLLRHHTKFYNENPGKAKKGDVMPREDGLHLSLQKKREILVNNLYGVDIDNQAVEVAQLSLYLKLLQDETPGSTRQYFLDFEQQALLPTLNKNIVCGNSLIGTDILSGELFEPVAEQKLNPMNFADRFPEIVKRGGFDAIVGNPPWGVEFAPLELNYLRSNYETTDASNVDSYATFIEAAIKHLKNGGLLGYIDAPKIHQS